MDGRIRMDTTGPTTVVVKRASAGTARRRLAHEAAMLEALAHPGVVRFVRFEDGEQHSELTTELAGAASLADHRPGTAGGVAGLLAAVAGIVADLHDAGVAHGALQPDHVILGSARHPVLCSFGRASRDPDARQQDVASLAAMTDELIAVVDSPRRGPERTARRAVEDAAMQLRSGVISVRELAGRLASIPGAALPHLDEPDPGQLRDEPPADALSGTRTWRHRVQAAVPEPTVTAGARRGLVAALAVVVAVVTLLLLRSPGGDLEAPAAQSGGAAAPTPEPTPPMVAETPSPPPDLRPPVSCPAGPDVDGDGCGDDTEIVGRLIRVGATWYTAGRAGDIAAVDHWRCAEVATPALLRPSTGEVFIFDAWPEPGRPLTVQVDHRVPPGAASLGSTTVAGCLAPVAGAS